MPADRFFPADPAPLLHAVLTDLERGQALGVPASLFHTPTADDPLRTTRFGRPLETPIGVAAGPHTQLAQNLVAAWLCGARYLELKTVQVLDELELTKPCIDMRDEGYNCEWSQELHLEQSFAEYLHGLLMILALRARLGFPDAMNGIEPGFICNMSAGYDLEGITSPSMSVFLDRMAHCPDDIDAAAEELATVCPELAEVRLPRGISDNLTISTMHGCPPNEVERIARHFIEDRGLHTTLKLNPTLLGPERVRAILGGLGWDLTIPDDVFAHDLDIDQAVEVVRSLSAAASSRGVSFDLKLTNTLPCLNAGALPENEEQVYMSGRPLHPLAVNVAALLRDRLGRETPNLSFCAGADAFNTPNLLAAGLTPVTICSDLLKPGGYGRLRQYLDVLTERLREADAENLEAFAAAGPGLDAYAESTTTARRYSKKGGPSGSVKIDRPLPRFDCYAAPCRAGCAAGQDVPAYLGQIAAGDTDAALATILDTNPLAGYLGLACDARCRKRCTRLDLDTPLRIKAAKHFAARHGRATLVPASSAPTAAVLGHDARSLACAGVLARAGLDTTIAHPPHPKPEWTRDTPAGKAMAEDLRRLVEAGVKTLETDESPDVLDARFDHVLAFTDTPPSGPGALPRAVAEARHAAHGLLAGAGRAVPERPHRPSPDPARLFAGRAVRDFGPAKVDDETMDREAARCLQCDTLCNICVTVCPNRAIIALPSLPVAAVRGVAERTITGPTITISDRTPLRDAMQIAILADFCNECGNCAAFCPSSGAPYRDKPRVHLRAASFAEEGAGYHFPAPQRLESLHGGSPGLLSREDGRLVYKDDTVQVVFDEPGLGPVSAELAEGVHRADLDRAMESALLFAILSPSPLFGGDGA